MIGVLLDFFHQPGRFEVVLVDHESRLAETRQVIADWAKREPERLRCLAYSGEFNFSRINNFAAAQAKGVVNALKGKSKPVVAELWGGPTDQNAFWFKSGNDAVLNPLFKSGLMVAPDCKDCHRALETHEIETWPRREWDERAILCGNCRELLTIREYLGCESRCPRCAASFNAKCENHHHFYFETPRR